MSIALQSEAGRKIQSLNLSTLAGSGRRESDQSDIARGKVCHGNTRAKLCFWREQENGESDLMRFCFEASD